MVAIKKILPILLCFLYPGFGHINLARILKGIIFMLLQSMVLILYFLNSGIWLVIAVITWIWSILEGTRIKHLFRFDLWARIRSGCSYENSGQ